MTVLEYTANVTCPLKKSGLVISVADSKGGHELRRGHEGAGAS